MQAFESMPDGSGGLLPSVPNTPVIVISVEQEGTTISVASSSTSGLVPAGEHVPLATRSALSGHGASRPDESQTVSAIIPWDRVSSDSSDCLMMVMNVLL